MSSPSRPSLTDHDRRIVRETVEELESAPPPSGRGPAAWLASLLGLGLLLGWPRISDEVPGGDFASPFVLLLGAVLVLVGPVLALFGGGGGERAAGAAVEAALRRLEEEEPGRETVLRAATLLLLHAHVSGESSRIRIVDPDDVAPRMGDHLPLVEAVERHLVEAGKADPVFTTAEDGP